MTLYRKFLVQVKVFTCILTLIMLIISLTIELFFYENGIEQKLFSWNHRSEMNAEVTALSPLCSPLTLEDANEVVI